MALTPDWRRRIELWKNLMPSLIYEPLGQVELEAYLTTEQLTVNQAARRSFVPMPAGTAWGSKWQYGWFRTSVRLPREAEGRRIVFRSGAGAEAAIYVNRNAAGAWDGQHKELTLSRRGVPGTVYRIMIEAYAGHGPLVRGGGPVPFDAVSVPEPPPAQVTTTATTFGIWHEDLFQLWMDVQTLWGLREMLPATTLRVREIDRGLREMTVQVDLELPRDELMKTVRRGRRVLKPLLECRNGSTAPTMYCFGHSHLDVAWLWPRRETEAKCTRMFGSMLAMLAEYKDMTFLQSQPHLYWMVKNRYPRLYARIRRAVKRGRWIPEGAMWVEADTNVTGGESLVRQFIHGKRFFREEFGVESRLLWLPDVFGYSGALPQILLGCGVPYFSTSKLFWTYGGGYPFPYNSFWWEGIDGSRVFAHLHHDYNNRTDPATMIARWERQPQEDGSSARMVAYGWGDGGGGPTREHLEYLQRQQDLEGAPRLRHSHPLDFFRDEKKREDDMPTYVGELYLQCHRGTYTTQARTKKGNRRSEFALRDAELWAATAAALTGHAYPQAQLRATWQQVLLNQFHDIIPGSSIERVHLEAEAGYAQAVKDARAVADRAARSFLGQDRETVTVFNSLSWPRDALVTLPEGFKGAVTGDGKTLPSQPAAAAAAADGATVVRVRDIPSCGWCVLRKGGPGRAENPLGVSPARLENEHLRIKINALGELVSVYDKDAGQELAAGPCNRFLMFKDVPNAYDAWDIDRTYRECPVPLAGKARITVKARGPLVAVLQVERRLHDSMLKQEIRLAAGSRRVDFVTRIDWQERHKLLKVAFPVDVRAEQAIHEIQFGHLSRPTHASNEFDAHRFEVCQQKWTALSENAHGVAVLNDCKYGISVDGNTMKLTLLKRSLAPDMHADRGLQTFRYALYAWNGSFADSGVVREAYELNVPVTLQAGDGGGEASLFGVDRANVIIETVKAAEDGSGDVIVRLYEAKRMRTRCTLSTALPVSRAQITNMLEEQGKTVACRRGRIRLSFRPFEIKTVRLRMQAAGAPGA